MARLPAIVIVLLVIGVIDVATMAYAVLEGPFPAVVPRGAPSAYRNLYVHVPVSIASYLAFTVAFIGALASLRGKPWGFRLADRSIDVAMVLGIASFLTGSVWASESWGSFWSWDPRQVGVFFLLMAYSIYYLIKRSVKDPDRLERVSMVYAAAAYSAIPLSFLLPYIAESLHPTIQQTAQLTGGMEALFRLRNLIVVAEALVVAYAYYKGVGSRILSILAALILLVGAASSLALLQGYLFGDGVLGRVVDAEVGNGTITMKLLVDGAVYSVGYSGEPPIKPLIVSFRGSEEVTLKAHLVRVDSLGDASRVEIVIHPVVALDTLIYSLAMAFIYTRISRLPRVKGYG